MQNILTGGSDTSSPQIQEETWSQIAPLLDGAMEQLGQKDHDALVLRFFQNKTFAEVGATLGASEDAAKMRVNRALEKLRKFFTKRGVSSTTAIIAGTISANSVQAAPVALAKTVTAVAIAKGAAVSASTLTLIKGALKIMAWTKAKMTIAISAGILLAAGTATITIKEIQRNSFSSIIRKTVTDGLDLDSGESVQLPVAVPLNPQKDAARYAWVNDPQNREWWRQHHVQIVNEQYGLVGVDVEKILVLNPADWQTMTLGELRIKFKKIGPNANHAYWNFRNGDIYGFQTLAGRVGILQILDAKPSSVIIQYKISTRPSI